LLPTRSNSRSCSNSQQRDLRFHWDFADFVQEDRPAVGGFKSSKTSLECAGEGAFFVPEKLGSDQRLWNRGAVDSDEGPGCASGPSMQRTRNQFFAGSGVAQDEDRRI